MYKNLTSVVLCAAPGSSETATSLPTLVAQEGKDKILPNATGIACPWQNATGIKRASGILRIAAAQGPGATRLSSSLCSDGGLATEKPNIPRCRLSFQRFLYFKSFELKKHPALHQTKEITEGNPVKER